MTEDIFEPGFSEEEEKLLEGLETEEDQLLSGFGAQRRTFLKQVLAGSGGVVALQLAGEQSLLALPAPGEAVPPGADQFIRVALTVNGSARTLQADPRMSLLDALREQLGLTGAKKGCDHGQCGACTVISDGQRILSCLTLAATCEGRSVMTIEGFARNGKLNPMQSAFLKQDGFQCGYCTPGQICSAIALMKEARNGEASYLTTDLSAPAGPVRLSPDEIRERMSGNICRCGAYPNIIAAIEAVHHGKEPPTVAWTFVEQNNHSI